MLTARFSAELTPVLDNTANDVGRGSVVSAAVKVGLKGQAGALEGLARHRLPPTE